MWAYFAQLFGGESYLDKAYADELKASKIWRCTPLRKAQRPGVSGHRQSVVINCRQSGAPAHRILVQLD